MHAKSIHNKPELNTWMMHNALLKEYIVETKWLNVDVLGEEQDFLLGGDTGATECGARAAQDRMGRSKEAGAAHGESDKECERGV